MTVPLEAPRSFGSLFELERARLLELLRSIEPAAWAGPTACPGWTVLGLTSHLLGDDLGLLSIDRDGHRGASPPEGADESGFIAWLDRFQIEWVEAARRMSPRVVTDLLAWTGPQIVEVIDNQDPSAVTAHVPWAGDEATPRWLDQARELSERWIHRQQLLEALNRPTDLRPDHADPVLDGLRWAYPYRLRAAARTKGTTVIIHVTGPEASTTWSLVSDGDEWAFGPGSEPTATIRLSTDQAWRLLTNNLRVERDGAIETTGDPELVDVLVRTRAIIGEPQ